VGTPGGVGYSGPLAGANPGAGTARPPPSEHRLSAFAGRGWSPVSSNKARACCCRTSCRPPSPIAAEACIPAVFTCMSVHRGPSKGRLPEVRGRTGAQAAGAAYASCRSGALYLVPFFKATYRKDPSSSVNKIGGDRSILAEGWKLSVVVGTIKHFLVI
jgi:hypothetical protein